MVLEKRKSLNSNGRRSNWPSILSIIHINTKRKKTPNIFLRIKIVPQSIINHIKSMAHIVPERSIMWRLNTHYKMSLRQVTFFQLFMSTSAWFGVFLVETNETILHRSIKCSNHSRPSIRLLSSKYPSSKHSN